MRTGKSWSNAEENFLIKNYSKMSIEEIAEFLEREPSATATRARILKLIKRKYIADFNDDILELSKAEYTASEIGKRLGFDTASIHAYCKENKIPLAKNSKTAIEDAVKFGFEELETMDLKDVTFSKWFKYWYQTYRRNGISEVTRQKYRITYAQIAEKELGNIKLSEVKRSDIQKYMDWYGMDRRKQTCLDHAQYIRSALKDAMIDGLIVGNPAENINITYKEQRLSPDEQKKIRNQKKWLEVDEYMKLKYFLIFQLETMLKQHEEEEINQCTTQVVYMMIFIALKTGARYAEILGLTKNDIDFENKIINIDKTWDYKKNESAEGGFTKTKNASSIRTIPVDEETTNLIGSYIDWLGNTEMQKDTLFVFKGKNVYNSDINRHLKKILKSLGIDYISFHKLRHTQASYLITKGIPLQLIAKRLGHTDTNMIQKVYGHLLQETEEDGNRMIRSLI